MRHVKWLVAALLVLAAAGMAGGVVWWISMPHTPQEQLARAEKLEKQLQQDAATQVFKDYEPKFRQVIEAYKRVEGKWGKGAAGGGPAVEAWKRMAWLQEALAKDRDKAVAAWEHLVRDYPAEDAGGDALLEQARLIRAQAEELKIGRVEEAIARYKQALEKLETYRSKFSSGKKIDASLMETGRIWMDGLGDPLINAMEPFEKVVSGFPVSEYRPEALYRLGQLMEKALSHDRALACYSELLEKYPTNKPWAEKAQFARGKLLAEKMDKPKEAAEAFRDLQEKFPDSPLKGEARSAEQSARARDAERQSEEYGRGRYGRMPADTLMDKAVPLPELLRKFIAQKLDAQAYDLHVTFVPDDHRISVQGTMTLLNHGEEKKRLLLMLSGGMEITEVAVNGVPAHSELSGEAWTIELAEPLKKDAAATLTFTYSGRFAEPQPGVLSATAEAGGPAPKDPAGGHAVTTAPDTSPPDVWASTQPNNRIAVNQQLMLGDFGYGLSGGAWYPITIIGDVFNAKVRFTAPPGVEVVANGALSLRDSARGEYLFETHRPVFGLYFVYGHYTVAEKQTGGIHYYTYLRPANAAKSDAYVAAASSILDFYASRFGTFPYEKMALIEAPLPPFLGGVGPASMMVLHEGMVAQKDVPSTLLAHELAHQWFGNLVPINLTDSGYNQWLSEGFATYADALYTEKSEGPEALARHMERYAQLYFQITLSFPRAAVKSIRDCVPMSAQYRPVVYEKGALVLHSLRKVMGDEKFFALLQRYVATYQDKPSVVNDFRQLASDVMGQDLSWFFAQWIDQAIYAHWVFRNVEMKGSTGGTQVSLRLEQPDDLITMPVDITLLGDQGQRQVVVNVLLNGYDQKVDLTVPFKPVKIILDEENWVLKNPKPDNIWPSATVEKPAVGK